MKSEWSRLALVSDFATRPNEVEPVRPSRISSLGVIVEAIDHGRKLDPEFPHAGVRNRCALILATRTAKEHLVFDIALHFPHVCRVSFKDIDSVKINLAFVLVRQFVQGGNLPPKGRSSVAAEHQDDRLLRPKRCQLHRFFGVQRLDHDVGCLVAYLEATLASSGPHCFERKEEISRHGHSRHDVPKNLRRLPHSPADEDDEAKPQAEERSADNSCPAFGGFLKDDHATHLVIAFISR
jgi:hypothetical protein